MTFDDVLAVGRLRECLESGTGKGVRIGLLDSGVASSLPPFDGCVVANYEVVEDSRHGARIVTLEKGLDVIEHGTDDGTPAIEGK